MVVRSLPRSPPLSAAQLKHTYIIRARARTSCTAAARFCTFAAPHAPARATMSAAPIAQQGALPVQGEENSDDAYSDEEEASQQSYENEEEEERVNLEMFGIRQALPIPEGEPDWDSGPPDSAEEYLRRVRAEAAACPRVVRVEFDAEAYAAKQRSRAAACQLNDGARKAQGPSAPTQTDDTAASTAGASSTGTRPSLEAMPGYVARLIAAGNLQDGPEWAQPSRAWVREFVTDFRTMRQWLVETGERHAEELGRVRLPHIRDVPAWDRICFGTRPSQPTPTWSESLTTDIHTLSSPTHTASALTDTHTDPDSAAAQQQHTAAHGALIQEKVSGPVLSTVLCLDQVAVGALLQRCVARVTEDGAAPLTETEAQWLFALAAALEKPAHCDVVAALRCLTRRVRALRSGLQSAEDPLLPRLNTLAVVAGAYFGQDDKLVPWVADMDLP